MDQAFFVLNVYSGNRFLSKQLEMAYENIARINSGRMIIIPQ